MKTQIKISNRFREILKQELGIWQTDGLLTSEQSSAISQRYQLDGMAKESTNRLLLAIYIIGAALIGAGAISFVAAHWEQIPVSAKVVMIIGFMLIGHITGFYLWKVSAKSPRLGHALIVLGTIVFGANIGLMAQIFHIQSNFYNGFYAWAIGAVIMAYAIESVPNAILAIIVSFVGFCGWIVNNNFWLHNNNVNFCYYPIIASIVFLPFSHLNRSRTSFSIALPAIGLSVIIYTGIIFDHLAFWGPAAAGAALLFFAYGLLANRTHNFNLFMSPAIVIAAFFAALGAYFSSFHPVTYYSRHIDFSNIINWNILIIMFFAFAILLWAFTLKGALINIRTRLISLSILVSSALIALPVMIPVLFKNEPDYFWTVLCSNIACIILSAGFITCSFRFEDRRIFWAGVLFSALVITSRFLEYETGLLIKAAVFIACGIGLIFAGIGFENYLKKRRLVNE